MELFKRFLKEEDGIGTVEIVLIIAVLVGLVLLFKDAITQFLTKLFDSIFGKESTVTKDPDKYQQK